MADLITQAEYARRRGVSQEAVRRAVAAKRITTVERDGKRLIDPEVANIQWENNTRPYSKFAGVDQKRPAGDSQFYDIKRARAKRESHEANLAEQRERRAAGDLIDRAATRKGVVDLVSMLRIQLEQVPGKLGARLATETEAAECRRLLADEMRRALADAARGLREVTSHASAADRVSNR